MGQLTVIIALFMMVSIIQAIPRGRYSSHHSQSQNHRSFEGNHGVHSQDYYNGHYDSAGVSNSQNTNNYGRNRINYRSRMIENHENVTEKTMQNSSEVYRFEKEENESRDLTGNQHFSGVGNRRVIHVIEYNEGEGSDMENLGQTIRRYHRRGQATEYFDGEGSFQGHFKSSNRGRQRIRITEYDNIEDIDFYTKMIKSDGQGRRRACFIEYDDVEKPDETFHQPGHRVETEGQTADVVSHGIDETDREKLAVSLEGITTQSTDDRVTENKRVFEEDRMSYRPKRPEGTSGSEPMTSDIHSITDQSITMKYDESNRVVKYDDVFYPDGKLRPGNPRDKLVGITENNEEFYPDGTPRQPRRPDETFYQGESRNPEGTTIRPRDDSEKSVGATEYNEESYHNKTPRPADSKVTVTKYNEEFYPDGISRQPKHPDDVSRQPEIPEFVTDRAEDHINGKSVRVTEHREEFYPNVKHVEVTEKSGELRYDTTPRTINPEVTVTGNEEEFYPDGTSRQPKHPDDVSGQPEIPESVTDRPENYISGKSVRVTEDREDQSYPSEEHIGVTEKSGGSYHIETSQGLNYPEGIMREPENVDGTINRSRDLNGSESVRVTEYSKEFYPDKTPGSDRNLGQSRSYEGSKISSQHSIGKTNRIAEYDAQIYPENIINGHRRVHVTEYNLEDNYNSNGTVPESGIQNHKRVRVTEYDIEVGSNGAMIHGEGKNVKRTNVTEYYVDASSDKMKEKFGGQSHEFTNIIEYGNSIDSISKVNERSDRYNENVNTNGRSIHSEDFKQVRGEDESEGNTWRESSQHNVVNTVTTSQEKHASEFQGQSSGKQSSNSEHSFEGTGISGQRNNTNIQTQNNGANIVGQSSGRNIGGFGNWLPGIRGTNVVGGIKPTGSIFNVPSGFGQNFGTGLDVKKIGFGIPLRNVGEIGNFRQFGQGVLIPKVEIPRKYQPSF